MMDLEDDEDSLALDEDAPKKFYWDGNDEGQMVSGMQSLFERGVSCDVVLKAGPRKFPAHRLVLSACSPYFERMFCGELREATQDTIVMHEIDPDILKAIIDYCYYNRFSIDKAKVIDLACTAEMLQFLELASECCDSMLITNSFTEANYMQRFALAQTHNLEEMKAGALSFMAENFKNLSHQGEFLELEFKDFEQVLDRKSLGVWSELDVFKAVVAWCQHNKIERKKHFKDLINHVWLTCISEKELTDYVESSPFVKENLEHCAAINASKKTSEGISRPYKLSIGIYPRHLLQGDSLYAIGGSNSSEILNTVERYDGCSEKWTESVPMEKKRSKAAACVYQNKVYVAGGSNRGAPMASMEMLDCDKNSWMPMQSLDKGRESSSFCECKGYLYALSGSTKGGLLTDTMERYDPFRCGSKTSYDTIGDVT